MNKMLIALLFLGVPLAATAQENDYEKLRSETALMFDRPLQKALEVLIDLSEEYEPPVEGKTIDGCRQEIKMFRAARSIFLYIERYELRYGYRPNESKIDVRPLARKLFELALDKLDWIFPGQEMKLCNLSYQGIHEWYIQIESNVPIAPAPFLSV